MWNSWESDSDDEEIFCRQRLPRLFRRRINTEFRTEYEFNERFRMNSVKMQELLDCVGHRLERATKRSEALDVKVQLCVGLHWLGTGAQYHAVADMHGVSKASVCRSVHNIVEAIIVTLTESTIKWPSDISEIITKFYNLAGMPLVVCCIDGTLINIDAPQENEEHYADRHGKHSINCMAVCGPDGQFYYVSARWPGSVHDSRVLRNSTLYQRMENGWRPMPGTIILGDSGYPTLDWLLTPVGIGPENHDDAAIGKFNRAHMSTRRIIENSFGILKEKFPCLNYMRLSPEVACNVFKCCTILSNFIRRPDDDDAYAEITTSERNNAQELANNEITPEGSRRLNQILAYFR